MTDAMFSLMTPSQQAEIPATATKGRRGKGRQMSVTGRIWAMTPADQELFVKDMEQDWDTYSPARKEAATGILIEMLDQYIEELKPDERK